MDSGTAWRLGHRPALDGLRGLAVLLVVADHAGYLPSGAGSVGVTIFFVLSGFLITRLIVEARDQGTWSVRRFYANRAVRLAPALLVMVGMVAAVLLAAGRSPGFVAERVFPALLYVENYMPRIDYPIFAHTWSLAVEEQFYLLWPLALPLFLRSRRRLRWIGVCIGVSLAVVLVSLGDDNFPIWGRTIGHFYGLLAGCGLALAGRVPVARRWFAAVGSLGIAGAVVAFAVVGDQTMVPRVLAVPFAVLLVAAAMTSAGPLMWSWLRFNGRISYALYLWHLPLLALTSTHHQPATALPVVLVSFGVATASTLLMEEPLRRAWRRRCSGKALDAERSLDGLVGARALLHP